MTLRSLEEEKRNLELNPHLDEDSRFELELVMKNIQTI